MRDDLDIIQQHLARHISALGTKGEHTSKAILQVFLCVLVVLVLLKACKGMVSIYLWTTPVTESVSDSHTWIVDPRNSWV